MRSSFILVAVALLSACSQHDTNHSQVQGHYEDFSPEKLEAYAQSLAFVPEYIEGQSVVVSEQIFGFAPISMLEGIINAGAPRLYIVAAPRQRSEKGNMPYQDVVRTRIKKQLVENNGGISSQLEKTLAALFSKSVFIEEASRLYPVQDENGPTVWARDWSPLSAKNLTGENIIMDLNYYPERQWDDGTPRAFLSYFTNPQTPHQNYFPKERVALPVYNEGGNFMNSPDWCFMTERVLEANTKEEHRGLYFTKKDAKKSGGKISADLPLDRDALIAMYNRFGCKQTEIFPRLPHEGTGHIDMWGKIIADNIVLVSDLRDESIEQARTQAAQVLRGGQRSAEEDISDMKSMQTFLRERQEWFRAHGFKVLTIPLPTNVFHFDAKVYKQEYKAATQAGYSPADAKDIANEAAQFEVTRSYTNSLQVGKTLLTPRYRKFAKDTGDLDYPDAALLTQYENEVRSTLEKEGFKVEFIETDELIYNGGSVHCTTMQVPW
jgi:hypothetical protein